MDLAIADVLRSLKPGVEYGEQALKGQIRKLLVDPANEKKIDNPALDLKVAAMLADKFTKIEREKKPKVIEVKYRLK